MSTNIITSIDTVYEKIGSKKNFLFPFWCETAIIDPDFSVYGQPFRCYSDNLFGSYKANGISYCDFILGLEEDKLNERNIFIYPNPVSSFLNLKGLHESVKICIHNSFGQKIMEFEVEEQVDVSVLPSGIYNVSFCLENGKNKSFKFIKE